MPLTDNLYLDMNGVVHNCVRGNAKDSDDSERYHNVQQPGRTNVDIFLDVFKYIDNIFAIIRPRKLLYFAIDGVAPRAKMNQQRSRRFRSARERTEEHTRRLKADPMYVAADSTPFDSNCISPGTDFMQQLTEALDYYVNDRISSNPLWSEIEVVLSGAEAYGEGEHKIMEYIRAVKVAGKMPPNTRHCLYGLDADLIMLALLSHEPHFFLLREKVDFSSFWKKKGGPRTATFLDTVSFGEFELLSIGLLREYLALDVGSLNNATLPFFDIERVVDDFVFMLMLVGNDFLPHLPTVEIADGSVVAMFQLYKRLLPRVGGYLTEKGQIIPERVELFIAKLSLLELRAMKRKESDRSQRRERPGPKILFTSSDDLDEYWGFVDVFSFGMEYDIKAEIAECRKCTQSILHAQKKRKYYAQKMGKEFAVNMDSSVAKMKTHYLQGIVWTMKYYFEGCQSWRWFYPYHYAPFPSDLIGIADSIAPEKLSFSFDKPFLPFQQLMSVLPPASAACVPIPYRKLMTSPDSPLRDFYKEDFETDLNGKRNDWEAVVLLPFVEEDRLIEAMAIVSDAELTPVERKRNTLGDSIVYRFEISFTKEVLSPFPQRLRHLSSHAKGSALRLPSIPRGTPFPASWVVGTHPAGSASWVSDLPTLYPMPHSGRLQKISVNLFGYPSRSESLVVSLGSKKTKPNDFIFFDDEDDIIDTPPAMILRGTDGKPTSNLSYRVPGNVEEVVLALGVGIGSQVWTHFPWRKRGTVEAIMDRNRTVERAPPPLDKQYTTENRTRQDEFETHANGLAASLMEKSGIDIDSPEVLVKVLPTPSSGDFMFSTPSEPTPSLLPIVTILSDDLAMKEPTSILPQPVRIAPPVAGMKALYVGRGPFFGSLCQVKEVFKDGNAKVLFRTTSSAAREMPFAYDIVDKWQSQRWKPLSHVANRCSLSIGVTNAFLGSVRVRLENGKDEIDLGLGIKYRSRGLHIPGYTKVNENGVYFFSEKTISLLTRYKDSFPELFEIMDSLMNFSRGSKSAPVYSPRQLFPNIGSIASQEAVVAIASWVSASDITTQPLVKSSSRVLHRDAVFELERNALIARMLQDDLTRTTEASGKKIIPFIVSQSQLRTGKESLNWEADQMPRIQGCLDPVPVDGSGLRLGDRVVNRISCLGIPFGLKGTVIGIHNENAVSNVMASKDEPERSSLQIESEAPESRSRLVEVVFDEEFIGGGNLNGLCNSGKGKAVPPGCLYTVRPDKDNRYYDTNYLRVSKKAKTKPENLADTYNRMKSVAKAAEQSYRMAIESRMQKEGGHLSGELAKKISTKPSIQVISKSPFVNTASKQSPKRAMSTGKSIDQFAKNPSPRITSQQVNRSMTEPRPKMKLDKRTNRKRNGVTRVFLNSKQKQDSAALTEKLRRALGLSTSSSSEESGADQEASDAVKTTNQSNGTATTHQQSRGTPNRVTEESNSADSAVPMTNGSVVDGEEVIEDLVQAWNSLNLWDMSDET